MINYAGAFFSFWWHQRWRFAIEFMECIILILGQDMSLSKGCILSRYMRPVVVAHQDPWTISLIFLFKCYTRALIVWINFLITENIEFENIMNIETKLTKPVYKGWFASF